MVELRIFKSISTHLSQTEKENTGFSLANISIQRKTRMSGLPHLNKQIAPVLSWQTVFHVPNCMQMGQVLSVYVVQIEWGVEQKNTIIS